MSSDAMLLSEVHARTARLNAEAQIAIANSRAHLVDATTLTAKHGLDDRSMTRLRTFVVNCGTTTQDFSPDNVDAYFARLEATRKRQGGDE